MTLRFLFWLIMLLLLLSYFAPWPIVLKWNWTVLFLLFGILGWKVFGKPITDG